MKNDKIDEDKLNKYIVLTDKALKEAIKHINKAKIKEAEKIIEMASCYLSDAKYFKVKEDFVNAFACINYAHGWLDCGARLGIFNVKDRRMFTIK